MDKYGNIRLHILRALDITHEQLNILNNFYIPLNAEDFGYNFNERFSVPKKISGLFPSIEELVPNCNC